VLPDRSQLDPLLRRAAPLTEYAWKFRYPGDPDEATAEEATEALATAREVLTWCCGVCHPMFRSITESRHSLSGRNSSFSGTKLPIESGRSASQIESMEAGRTTQNTSP